MFYPVGDSAVCFQYENPSKAAEKIQRACKRLKEHPVSYVTEWVPGVTTITFFYLPHKITYQDVCNSIETVLSNVEATVHNFKIRKMQIPVCYGGEYGPDLEYVARLHGLTSDEVIDLHSSATYTVNLMGFVSGFVSIIRRPNPTRS